MTQILDRSQDITKRAHDIYQCTLRAQVEHDDNIGKILVLDVDTGNYEIDEDGIVANDRLRERLPNLIPQSLYAFRIGYGAVYAISGTITRTYSDSEPVPGEFDSAEDLRRMREER